MTTSKYFGINGLAADVQFGKSGPHIVASASGFSLTLASGTAAPLSIGPATLSMHAVTKAALDAVSLSLSNATAALSTTIGLDANGNFVIPGTATILTAGMTLAAGLVALDAAATAEATRAKTAESGLGTRVTTLEGSGQQTGALIGTITGSVGLDSLGRLSAFTGTTYLGSATTVRTALVSLDTAAAALDAKYASKTSDLSTQIGLNTSAITALNQQVSGQNNAHVLLDDGSHPLAADLSAAGFSLINVRTPVNRGDVATKGYTDDKFALIVNPFQYIGVINGGASASSATNLASLSKTSPGDYYKVSAAGYFQFGSGAAVYANLSDGIIFNTTSGFDVIGGSDTKIFGTAAAIAVTGAAETGFTIDLDSSVKTRLSNVEGVASANASAITATNAVANRVIAAAGLRADGSFNAFTSTHYLNGSTTLAGALSTLDSTLGAAQTATGTVATNLAAAVAAVGLGSGYVYTPAANAVATASATTIAGAVSVLDSALAQTNTNVGTVSTNLGTLTSRVTAGFTGAGLSAAGAYIAVTSAPILSGATSLANADSLLEARIVANRTAADSGFSAASTALSTAQSTLQGKIIAVATGAGLNADGSYATSAGRFIASATSLANADLRLDGALSTLRNDFDTRPQDRIHSTDSLAQVVVASSTAPLTISAPVGGVSATIAAFTTTASTNASLGVDLTQSGYVTLRATSTSAAAATLQIASQGGAPVEIGDEDADSMIQPKPGRALTLAGGDAGSGTGGNLLLRGGTGAAGNGIIVLCDAASNPLLTFSAGLSGIYLDLSAAAGAATLSAQGSASDIDVVITTKGAGTVSASGARVTEVGDASGQQDAVNLQTLGTKIAAALVATVQTMSAQVSETTGVITLGSRPGAQVMSAHITVVAPFDPGTTILMGDADNPSYILDFADLDLTQAVTYALDLDIAIDGSKPILCDVTASSNASAGSLTVSLVTAAA